PEMHTTDTTIPASSTRRRAPSPPLFPYTTLFRSMTGSDEVRTVTWARRRSSGQGGAPTVHHGAWSSPPVDDIHPHHEERPCRSRSEEHTSELQSRENLVCRLLLEKKKKAVDLLDD